MTLLDIAPGPLEGDGVARVLEIVARAPDVFASRGEARTQFVAAGVAPALADWLLLNLEPAGDTYRWRIDRSALAALHTRMAREDLWPVVEERARLVAALRAWRGVALCERRRCATARGRALSVVTIAGAGHFLHAERPREVAEAIAALGA